MPSCEPVQCDQEEITGELRSVVSYGRRRRRRSTSANLNATHKIDAQEDLLLVQSIHITDKFGFDHKHKNTTTTETVFMQSAENINGLCINVTGLILAAVLFLAAQMTIIAGWTFVWQRRRMNLKHCQDSMSVSVSLPSGLSSGGRTDSLCKLYDTGYTRRF